MVYVTACTFMSDVASADPGSSAPLEYHVKAAFLYRFIKFVEWPSDVLSDDHETITIGICGGGPMSETLRSIEDKIAKGRRVVIKRFADLEDLEPCNILFISCTDKDLQKDKTLLERILKKLEGTSTLTVSDVKGFARLGGMINFIILGKNVHLEINPEAVNRANLKISSKLLRLAKIVEEKE